MTFPCQKRVWQLLMPRDKAFMKAVFQYGVPHRTLAALMGTSRVAVRRKAAKMLTLLRDERLIKIVTNAKGDDLVLLKYHYFYGWPACLIARYAGIGGDNGGKSAGAIRRRIRRIVKEGDCDG